MARCIRCGLERTAGDSGPCPACGANSYPPKTRDAEEFAQHLKDAAGADRIGQVLKRAAKQN